MTQTDAIASLALAVSCFSLGVSWWGTFRDRVALKITAKVINGGPQYGPASISIKVVNTGRRIAVLTMFGGELLDGTWQGTYLGASGQGIHLAESELHQRNFGYDDIETASPDSDSDSEFVALWFEDSHGKRHKVPNSEKLIIELKKREGPPDRAAVIQSS